VHIGFREQDCALLEQHVGERRVGLRTIILEERRARGRRKAHCIDIVLKHHRQAGKWPELRASSADSIDLASVFQ
jgi:hypothetical protein